MKIDIRTYDEGDLETCRHLQEHLTGWHREIYDSPGIGGDTPGLQFDKQLAAVGAERIWVAEMDGKIVGMTGLQPGSEDGSLEVEPLIVAPEARGHGVGRALIEHLVTVVAGLGLRDLNVRVVGRNDGAIRFYHDLGFDTIGYIELFRDTTPKEEQLWRDGEVIADRTFRV